MKRLLPLLVFVFTHFLCNAQNTFQKTYGGSTAEFCWDMITTPESGFVILGSTSSYGPTASNLYLLKLDNLGDTLWTRAIGGADSESGRGVNYTKDLGYIVFGSTYSFGAGVSDALVVKTDYEGNTQWAKTYGGIYAEDIVQMMPTFDDEYMMFGSSSSFGGSVTDADVYVIKTDFLGDTLWTRRYGGLGEDNGLALIQTADSGYVATGYTKSFGAGQDDAYLLKFDNDGNVLWMSVYGGTDSDVGSAVIQTADGGYAVAGKTHSFGAWDGDVYLIKTTDVGDTMWTKTYGGIGTDWCQDILQTDDGGFILSGETYSFGAGGAETFLLKTDSLGNFMWMRTYGGPTHDYSRSVALINDGGYALAGHTANFGSGSLDMYLIKTDSAGVSYCNEMTATPSAGSPSTQVTVITPFSLSTNTIVTTPSPSTSHGSTPSLVCQATIGVADFPTDNHIAVFPNPSAGWFTVDVESLNELVAFNTLGEVVAISNNKSIDLTNQPTGVYVLKIVTPDVIFTHRVVKQ